MNVLFDMVSTPVMVLVAVAGVGAAWYFLGGKAAVVAAAAAVAALYTKVVRKSAKDEVRQEARVNDLEQANEILEDAANARADSGRATADADRVRDADRHCRDC